VKEAMFNILAARLGNFSGLHVLDLFTGSGALGIEALSRGAASAIFVDNSQVSAALARKNLELAGFADRGRIICHTASTAVGMLASEGRRFHLIMLDPPYSQGLAEESVKTLANSAIIEPEGVVVVETGKNEILPEAVGCLGLVDKRTYGDTSLTIYTNIINASL
jgi:16S rRNA (guanine(966)-N(2))-methyltransferase RsmD